VRGIDETGERKRVKELWNDWEDPRISMGSLLIAVFDGWEYRSETVDFASLVFLLLFFDPHHGRNLS